MSIELRSMIAASLQGHIFFSTWVDGKSMIAASLLGHILFSARVDGT